LFCFYGKIFLVKREQANFKTFEKVFFGHPELVLGFQNMLILLDAETSSA